VYNGMPYLPDLIDSLLAQSTPALEIVLSDGGSNDGSSEYVATLDDPRIRLITEPSSSGAAGNWTAACRAATGTYVKLICQDDLLYPEAIAWQVADLEANPEAVMAVARRDIVDASGRLAFRGRGLPGLSPGVHAGDSLIRACYLAGTNIIGEPLAVLFRRQALDAALPWVDDNPLMLDLNMYAKVAKGAQVVVRLEAVGAFRVSAGSWSTRLASTQADQTRAWQQAYAAAHPPSTVDHLRARLGRSRQVGMRRAAYAYLRASHRLEAPRRP